MRIAIDMQGLQTPYSKTRGVGRHTLNMVMAFLKLAQPEHEIFFVLNGFFKESVEDICRIFKDSLPRENIKVWQQYLSPVSGISENIVARNCAELIREWYITQLDPDIVWSTNLQEGWLDDAVTSVKKIKNDIIYCSAVHDVIPLLYPDKHLATDIKYWYQEKIDYVLVSDIILTGSNFSKEKIIELLDADDNKIVVAENSIDRAIFNDTINSEQSYDVGSKFILYVGGADKHKNLEFLVSVYSMLSEDLRKQYKLLLVGQNLQSTLNAEIPDILLSLGDSLIFIEYVSDAELSTLYKTCSLSICPSYSEGFGLPLLEAMSCGAPVLAALASSYPEIMVLEEAMFDPFDKKNLLEKMSRALLNNDYKSRLQTNGLKQSARYSWTKSAKIILNSFETVFANRVKQVSQNKSVDIINIMAPLLTDMKDEQLKLVAKSISDNSVPNINSKQTIYLDLSNLVHFDHATGIQRVSRAIKEELVKYRSDVLDIQGVFSYAGHDKLYKIRDINDYTDISLQSLEIVDFNDGDILLFLDLHPSSIVSKHFEIHRLRHRGIKVYFIVYDLIPISHSQYFVKELSVEFEKWLSEVINSSGAICISRDVATKLEAWIEDNSLIPSPDFSINHFHLGADISKSKPSTGLPRDYKIDIEKIKNSTSFLMVGTIEPRKGHKLVLDTFERLWAEGLDVTLIIVGKIGWCCGTLKDRLLFSNLTKNNNFYFYKDASDEYLELLYKTADCLIAASKCEGFGLPLIEAAQYKLPIIARDIPVFREVAGEHAYYFDSKGDNLAEIIELWLQLHKDGKEPKSENMPWLTWKESAKQLMSLLIPKK